MDRNNRIVLYEFLSLRLRIVNNFQYGGGYVAERVNQEGVKFPKKLAKAHQKVIPSQLNLQRQPKKQQKPLLRKLEPTLRGSFQT